MNNGTLRYITVHTLIWASLTGCTLAAELTDISSAELNFSSPAKDLYTNKTSFDFRVSLQSSNPDLKLEQAKLHVFYGADCLEDAPALTQSFASDGVIKSQANLENGKVYSAYVTLEAKGRLFRSVCSPWVGVDTESPEQVSVQYPANDTYVVDKKFLASWSPSTDNGISGLAEKPYRIRLYGQPACGGPALQTVDDENQHHLFENLTHGITYSVLVSALDRAHNESVVTCSPYTEVDIYAPGFSLHDPTSVAGYSRVLNPQVTFLNDDQASFWCITSNLSFRPSAHTDTCPGGTGAASGWHTTRPTNLVLLGGDGLKTYNLWAYRSNGTQLSQNVTSAAIVLDRTLPGAFSVTGIGTETYDTLFDEWLTGSEDPILKWSASSDAADYSLQILNASSTIVCEIASIPGASTQTGITPEICDAFINGQTYTAVLRSFDAARNSTQAPSFNFTIDRTPPLPFVIGGVAGGLDIHQDAFFGAGSPTIYFSNSTGATKYQIEIKDSMDLTVCSQSTKAAPTIAYNYATDGGTCVLIDGSVYHVNLAALDDGGNRTPATNNGYSFRVDLQNPTLSITSTPIGLTQATSASFTFETADSASGVAHALCAIDGGAYSFCTSPKFYGSMTESSHTFSVKAVDNVGNETIRTETWSIDLTAPALTITSGPPPVSNIANVSFEFIATDISGIASYTCGINSPTLISCQSPHNFTVAEGVHSYIVRATDPLSWYDEKQVSFLVDLTAPTINISTGPSGISNSTTASFTFAATDLGGSGVQGTECSWDNSAFANCSSPDVRNSLSDGVHTFAVRATDQAGNQGPASTRTWVVYTLGPIMSWDSTPPARTNLTTLAAAFHATVVPGVSVNGYECRLNGGAWASCTSIHSVSGLAQGTHTLSVRAQDSLGNTGAPISTTWYTDLTGPTTTITSGPSGAIQANSATFAFSAGDAEGSAIAGFECSLNNAAFVACNSPMTYSSLAEGSHNVRVRAVDSVGNEGAIVTRNFITDYTAPSVNITSGPANPTDFTNTASIAFTATDNVAVASVQCQLNGGAWTSCGSPASYASLGAGSHTVTVRVTDSSGRTSTDSHTWVIYTYTWNTGGFSACSAAQPAYTYGGWGACSVSAPAYQYGGWSACSVACGGGTQTRAQTCNTLFGTQTRTYSCPTNTGTQTRSVACVRNDGAAAVDAKCAPVGGKPATSQGCSRNDCAGSPANSQGCNTGGACHSAQGTSQSCNPQSCSGTWQQVGAQSPAGTPACASTSGTCSPIGATCGFIIPGRGMGQDIPVFLRCQ